MRRFSRSCWISNRSNTFSSNLFALTGRTSPAAATAIVPSCSLKKEQFSLIRRGFKSAVVFDVRRLATMATQQDMGPIEGTIREKLQQEFAPLHFDVVNESFRHNVPKGSETHFKVLIVSSAFEGKNPVQRHRMVNNLLSEELEGGVHALSIQAKTPEQWAADPAAAIQSTPNCRGGDGSL